MNKLFLLLLLILLIVVLYFCLNFSEEFSEVSLENSRCFYNNFRDLIDGRENNSYTNNRCRDIPYTINTNCFADKYSSCRSHNFNKVSDNLCKEKALSECVVRNRPLFI